MAIFNSYVSLPEGRCTVVTLPAAQKEHHMSVSTEMKDLPVNGSRFLTYTPRNGQHHTTSTKFPVQERKNFDCWPHLSKSTLESHGLWFDFRKPWEAIFLKGHFQTDPHIILLAMYPIVSPQKKTMIFPSDSHFGWITSHVYPFLLSSP